MSILHSSLIVTNGSESRFESGSMKRKYELSSLIKMPILECVLRAMSQQKDGPFKLVHIQPHHISQASGIITWQKRRIFTLKQLIGSVLQYSDSTATNCLIDYAGGPNVLRQFLKTHYPNTTLLINYVHFPNSTDASLATSTAAETFNMIDGLTSALKGYPSLHRYAQRMSKNGKTWIQRNLPDGFEVNLVKTGSMYEYDDMNSYVQNCAGQVIRLQDTELIKFVFLSTGQLSGDTDVAIEAQMQTDAYTIALAARRLYFDT